MAYTTPRTWVAGEYPTAAQMNANVRDNVAFLANPPACRVFHNVSQSVPNNTSVALAFNSERYDTDGMHSTSVNTSRITFNTAGLYIVGGQHVWPADNDLTETHIQIRLNGATLTAIYADRNPGTSNTSRAASPVVTTYKFAANDYIELVVTQVNTSAGSASIAASGNYSPEFWATWLGIG